MHSTPRSAGIFAVILAGLYLGLAPRPAHTAARGEGPSPAILEAACCHGHPLRAERVLRWRVGPVSHTGSSVADLLSALVADHDVPISFIQADPEATVSLSLADATVADVLDAVVRRAPVYRYEILHDRLVLFPRDPRWMVRLDALKLGPASRLAVASDLSHELSQRVPALGGLAGPAAQVVGRAGPIYRDEVTVATPATVLELLVQLLGERRTAVFEVSRGSSGGQWLDLGSVRLFRLLILTADRTLFRDRTDTAQLKVVGTLAGLDERRDLTASECGTTYTSSNPTVVAVSSEGLVRVQGSGTAVVTAWNADAFSTLPFTVVLPREHGGGPPRGTTTGARSQERQPLEASRAGDDQGRWR